MNTIEESGVGRAEVRPIMKVTTVRKIALKECIVRGGTYMKK